MREKSNMKTKQKYVYNGKVCIPVKAEIVGRELERLTEENDGALLPDTVLRAAQSKRSVLHPCFEWNDTTAAYQYRIEQAKHLLRAVVVVVMPPGRSKTIEVRAFPCIETDGGNYYTTYARVYASKELTNNVDAQILRNLLSFRQKYHDHKVFAKVWHAIDKVKI